MLKIFSSTGWTALETKGTTGMRKQDATGPANKPCRAWNLGHWLFEIGEHQFNGIDIKYATSPYPLPKCRHTE
jgi:hypothetical protein